MPLSKPDKTLYKYKFKNDFRPVQEKLNLVVKYMQLKDTLSLNERIWWYKAGK